MRLSVDAFAALGSLPADCEGLLAAGARRSFQLSAAWFGAVGQAALPAGTRAMFLVCRDRGRPLAVFPLCQGGGQGAGLAALSTPYTCLYEPLTAANATPEDMRAAGAAFGRFCAPFGAVRLEAMDAGWPGLPPLLAGLGEAGLVPLRFAHFGNWYEPVSGLRWADYLAGRPGSLRETIRRRLRRAENDPAIALEMICGPAALEAGIAAYETVYARSWKRPEPFPAFSAALMRAAGDAGVLRLGILRQHGQPVAAQYWLVRGGTAMVAKLAHDEAAKALSPGTALTAAMVRGLLDGEAVAELDFGRGDDAYKADWASRRRQRIGFMLANPRRARGLWQIVRHRLGRLGRTGQALPKGNS